MKRSLILAAASAAMLVSCTERDTEIAVVPNPVSIRAAGSGAAFNTLPIFDADTEELMALAATFTQTVGDRPLPEIKLRIDTSLEDEEYVLDSRRKKVDIRGGSTKGVWWGLQTLIQILPQSDVDKVPGLVIKDRPAFAYRGAHFDCCRHFFSTDQIKNFLDEMSLHKLNVFHWHLTDDQGWRIEIKKYPLLTEVGSKRAETLVGHYGSDTYDGIPYGGCYTQEELREIVAYAAQRQITVIPEIEMPGHASAALAAYPKLGCSGKDYKVQTTWGVFPEIFCAGNPEVLQFLKDVLDEVCDIFPSEYIHIGGDEAPRDEWESCPKCQTLMKEMGLKTEAQLQSYIVNEIEKYLNSGGRKIIGWDEILEGGVSTSATVMSWRGPDGGIAAAKLGNNVIMTPNSHFYLDYYQTADPDANGEPLGIGGHLPLRTCYSFDPYDGLDKEEQSHIIGIQANLWTEYISSYGHAQRMVLPRHAALSEVAWSNSNRTDYESFVERVRRSLLPVYEERGYEYADYAFRTPAIE